MPQRRYPLRLWNATTLAASATLESGVIDCRTSDPEGLMFKVSAVAETADVKIEVAFSNDGATFNEYDTQDSLVDSTNTDWASTNPEDYHLVNIPWAPFVIIRITELSTTNAATLINGTLWMTEL